MTTNQLEELQTRLMMLEKCLQLKTNECAYYRTKVHLMQIKSKQPANDCLTKQQSYSFISLLCFRFAFLSNIFLV